MKGKKGFEDKTSEERGSVKHEPNSIQYTQSWGILGTARGDGGAQGASTREQTDQPCLGTNLLEYIGRVKSLMDLTC